MHVIDASVWVSYFVSVDHFHASSQIWLERQVEAAEQLVVPAILLAEVAGAIARRTDLPELGVSAVDLILRLPNTKVVPLGESLSRLSAAVAAHRMMRGAHAIYIATASRMNVPPVTWDHEMIERGSAVATVFSPPFAPAAGM